uniref:Secreted protein n=1 Tax=Ixodes ricinus TaxID=34613 RepID=A0A6B0UCU9_IXORI
MLIFGSIIWSHFLFHPSCCISDSSSLSPSSVLEALYVFTFNNSSKSRLVSVLELSSKYQALILQPRGIQVFRIPNAFTKSNFKAVLQTF